MLANFLASSHYCMQLPTGRCAATLVVAFPLLAKR